MGAFSLCWEVWVQNHGEWAAYGVARRVGALAALEDAAALVAVLGDGATIRRDGFVLWNEGRESQSAGESYDHVAALATSRFHSMGALRARRRVAAGGGGS